MLPPFANYDLKTCNFKLITIIFRLPMGVKYFYTLKQDIYFTPVCSKDMKTYILKFINIIFWLPTGVKFVTPSSKTL